MGSAPDAFLIALTALGPPQTPAERWSRKSTAAEKWGEPSTNFTRIAMRFAAVAGSVMLVLMWNALLPPQDDLFLGNHTIYAWLLIGPALVGVGNTLGLERRFRCRAVIFAVRAPRYFTHTGAQVGSRR